MCVIKDIKKSPQRIKAISIMMEKIVVIIEAVRCVLFEDIIEAWTPNIMVELCISKDKKITICTAIKLLLRSNASVAKKRNKCAIKKILQEILNDIIQHVFGFFHILFII